MKFTFAQHPDGFDNHIMKSIRGYDDLKRDILKLSEYFVEDHTNVVDIGCSTGRLLQDMVVQNSWAPLTQYIGIEIEEDFTKSFNDTNQITFFAGPVTDYIEQFGFKNCSLITSIFTLQFLPAYNRQDIINHIYNGLNIGGAFIFCEKTLQPCAKLQEIITHSYYDFKRSSFTPQEILDKEYQLRHMIKSNTRDELISMCKLAGFVESHIASFWQNHSFVGLIAIK